MNVGGVKGANYSVIFFLYAHLLVGWLVGGFYKGLKVTLPMILSEHLLHTIMPWKCLVNLVSILLIIHFICTLD